MNIMSWYQDMACWLLSIRLDCSGKTTSSTNSIFSIYRHMTLTKINNSCSGIMTWLFSLSKF